MHDIVVIGGGTAGLTAAIYAARAGKSVLILEGNGYGGQITAAPKIQNYPGFSSISGTEFADKLTEQALSFGAETEFEAATSITTDPLCVNTESASYPCKAVIIATGAKHKHLGVKGESEFEGKGVSYCAVCDGAFYKDKTVAVIGGGNTAMNDADFLSGYCKKVYVVHRRDTFRATGDELERLNKPNIERVMNSTVSEIVGGSEVRAIKLNKSGTEVELKVDGVFVAVGQAPDNRAFANVIELDESGFAVSNEDCKGKVDGVFVAGDCRRKQVRQLTTAVCDGAVAALAACKSIRN